MQIREGREGENREKDRREIDGKDTERRERSESDDIVRRQKIEQRKGEKVLFPEKGKFYKEQYDEGMIKNVQNIVYSIIIFICD